MESIPYELFLERTGFPTRMLGLLDHGAISQIIPLRDMRIIDAIIEMPDNYLFQLLRKIGLVGAPDIKVYGKSIIRPMSFDSTQLYVGQAFVSRRKYTAIIENFQKLFRTNNGFYLLKGISKLAAAIIIGKDTNGVSSLAHYIPPIIELHAGKAVIMDGIHRNFIIRASGTSMWSIIIDQAEVAFPTNVEPWESISIVDEKPEKKEDRFFDLRMHLFRDLNFVGIDG